MDAEGVYFLGVDIGTYESKAVLTNLEGRIVHHEVISHQMIVPKPGLAEHDADGVWWHDFCLLVERILQATRISSDQIKAIGCSAIAPAVLPVDREGKPLRPAILYGIDTRAVEEIRELEHRFGHANVFQRCGNDLSTQAVGPKILWIKKHEPEVYAQTARFLTATSYLVYRLTGKFKVDHYTAGAGFTPFYDCQQHAWYPEFCKDIVEIDQLPEIGWTTDIAGVITDEAAQLTGLSRGTPVIIGTSDAAAEAVSVGVVKPGQMMLMYGSTAFFIEVTNEPIQDSRLWSAPYLFPDTYALLGGMSTTGAITRWMRDQFAVDLVKAEQYSGKHAFESLMGEAVHIPPGSEGMVTLPYFSGERTPIQDPMASGVVFGLTLAHTRGHLFRSILEGVGYGINHHLEVMKEIGAMPSELVAVGGGTKNELWLQIVSDIAAEVQKVPKVTIGASYGDAFLAAVGSGHLQPGILSEWVQYDHEVTPNRLEHQKYMPYYSVFKDLYQSTKSLMHRMYELRKN
ncbi:FGGY-family carbohydrate kinase [Cohnella faecalis]|uniref:FGGY-family carbohydrate kinase n=1 Tax=Cohnella faecalis TaxID=2315694 RepID=UPI001313F306|nr:FGGY-family carbohydrate kinase [Cohnella faecalis]